MLGTIMKKQLSQRKQDKVKENLKARKVGTHNVRQGRGLL
jgi:hypothetical protein